MYKILNNTSPGHAVYTAVKWEDTEYIITNVYYTETGVYVPQ